MFIHKTATTLKSINSVQLLAFCTLLQQTTEDIGPPLFPPPPHNPKNSSYYLNELIFDL